FYGDPETNEGWTATKGYIENYLRDSVGFLRPELPADYRFTLGMGADNYNMLSGDTAVIWLAQFVARGASNLNSVTILKQLSDVVQAYFESNFTIGVKQIGSEVPAVFSLAQNYPNPFNPVTKMRFQIPSWEGWTRNADGVGFTKLIIYDMAGREVQTLVNEVLQPGRYEVTFDGHGFASGVYFYQLTAGSYKETRRMVLVK
ncbi:MAG: T9SS type A sorting domain-containing protein, partial [Ignavibacteria bacterium]|nr:T9SS type A sorting domain-containing protein [Ignavibacteria bacterium]